MPTNKPRMNAQVFARSYNRRAPGRVSVIEVQVPAGASLDVILAAYLAAGGSKGNGTQAGPFEVQTDEGIWSHPAERSLLAWNDRRFVPSARATFATWEQLEAAELAARNAA